MAYADFDFYKNKFFGDVLMVDNAEKWLSVASDELDIYTWGRLEFAFPENELHVLKIKKAACAIAEALYNIEIQRKALIAKQDDNGTYHGVVASVSSGRESISYVSNSASDSIYVACAASEDEKLKYIGNIVAHYLANIPDSNGTNLLYAGV